MSAREEDVAGDGTDSADPIPEPTYSDPNRSDPDPDPEAREAPVRPGETQDAPAMDMDQPSIREKIDGIVAQTRVDVGGQSHERIVDVLRQRLVDAGISADDRLIEDLGRQVTQD
ncbi:hypothetical protein [Microbacterium caowuchunii]|uniref:Uncharacterized protein n=1 Tax=Microbacterium caowuchunii TaxID=2614638 RepID=A0A5N0THB6_9MICO|nr:hypothetical protein [Microbacterium caowuchunii]KAA9133834.1 hypothetical protein F6B40_08780 [Microbacterium caowuchunii]